MFEAGRIWGQKASSRRHNKDATPAPIAAYIDQPNDPEYPNVASPRLGPDIHPVRLSGAMGTGRIRHRRGSDLRCLGWPDRAVVERG